MEKEISIKYQEYNHIDELPAPLRNLMHAAMEATGTAYAPYSGFRVGAALLLADGTVVRGSNQENAAYPSGLCAERTALFAASAQRPDARDYAALAIVGKNAAGEWCEASPCGACRQVMAEYEQLQGHPMQVACYLKGGRARVIGSVKELLPFGFEM